MKRSDKVWTYKGKWNSVAGYLDDLKPLSKKALQEISEEIGVQEENILKIKIGDPFEFADENIKKTWIVHPLIAELKNKPEIKLDFEHTEYKWIQPEELGKQSTRDSIEEMGKDQILFIDSLDSVFNDRNEFDGIKQTTRLLIKLSKDGKSPLVLANIHDPSPGH